MALVERSVFALRPASVPAGRFGTPDSARSAERYLPRPRRGAPMRSSYDVAAFAALQGSVSKAYGSASFVNRRFLGARWRHRVRIIDPLYPASQSLPGFE